MADKATIVAEVSLDTAKAEQGMARLRRAARGANDPAATGDGVSGRIPYKSNLPRGFSAQPEAEAPASGGGLGRLLSYGGAGMAIAGAGSLVGGIVGNMEGGARTGRRISSVTGGIGGGLATGAMLGSVIPGVGTAFGAIVGGMLGGAASAFKQLSEEVKETRERLHALGEALRAPERSQAVGERDRAFERKLSLLPIATQRSAVGARIQDLKRGDGENSLLKIRRRMEAAVDKGATDTNAYKDDQTLLGVQQGRLANLLRKREDLSYAPMAKLLDPSSVTDSLGKIGGSVGAQVDVGNVQRDMLTELRQINRTMEHLANLDPSRTAVNQSSYARWN